jgi:hypothetical protein
LPFTLEHEVVMNISQRNFWNKTNFQFGEDTLKYTIKSESNTSTFSVKYDAISTDRAELETRRNSFRNFGILMIIVGVVHLSIMFLEKGSFAFSVWFAIGLLFLVTYYLTKTAYSVIQTDKYSILIIKDKKHDIIFKEIFRRRKSLYLSLYGNINYENDPNDEINKFQWLKANKMISESEYNEIINKIKLYHESTLKKNTVEPGAGKYIQ